MHPEGRLVAANEREVKDFDIFVQVPDWEDDPCEASELIDDVVRAVNDLFYQQGGPKSESLQDIEKEEGYGGYDIYSVWGWTHGFNSMPCDIVFIRDEPIAHLKQFDFGLCQALVSPSFGLRTTGAYQRDAIDKTITFLLGPEERDRSRAHLHRFLPKYQGWKVRGISA